ncbi:hypothetical protein HCG49_08665 [Arenibacter sp. 6A1]|uniref:hypothetical protein n=1 Tax=Arenibacter sp. 6A1 TaxID=2720391 RepID=UPI0014466430|nr:hypothetical protein [Arenibacter sp. 6A1]NKI26632.1 hypothetical protein [Arenibacter sp. 6A1]
MTSKLYFLGVCFLLFACEGSERTVNEEGIINNMNITNLYGDTFPWSGIASGHLKRWDIDTEGLIPVKTNNNALAIKAMDKIEEVMGVPMFDRTSIANVPNDEITRGLIISEGTAIGPGGVVDKNSCGMVSKNIGTTAYPNSFYTENGTINTVLYVHLSSSKCTASLEVAIHEFGHAMGAGAHFNGFGHGDAINNDFWNVLYNLYKNVIGATENQLIIDKIK